MNQLIIEAIEDLPLGDALAMAKRQKSKLGSAKDSGRGRQAPIIPGGSHIDGNRVQERVDALGGNTSMVAEQGGMRISTLHRLSKPGWHNCTSKVQQQLITTLKCSLAYLQGRVDDGDPAATTITITWVADLSTYSMALAQPKQDNLGRIEDIAPPDRFKGIPRRGVDVQDDSLAGLKDGGVPRGYVALVIDFQAARMAVEENVIYFVRHKLNGRTQLTFRRARLNKAKATWEFRPVTGDPVIDEQEVVKCKVKQMAQSKDITILGIFYSARRRIQIEHPE